MKMPHAASSAFRRYLFGRNVASRLARARQAELLARVNGVNAALLAAWRADQDARVPVEEATALRETLDADLDRTARLVRKDLASRSLRAEREAPYTLVLPLGIQEYVQAKLADQVPVYRRLCSRLLAHLGPTDPMCVSAIPEIESHIVAWTEAVDALDRASRDLDLVRTRLAVAEQDWARTIERVYGTLIASVGKPEAERFFPKAERRRDPSEDEVPTETFPRPEPAPEDGIDEAVLLG